MKQMDRNFVDENQYVWRGPFFNTSSGVSPLDIKDGSFCNFLTRHFLSVLIAVGYTKGTITIFHFRVNYNTEGDGKQTISFVDKHNIWDDVDEISVTNLAFIRTKVC